MLALSPSLELSSLSSFRCLQVYNCRNFHASSVSESRSVVTFQLPLSPSLQLSVLSCLLCLQVWNCRHFQACTPLKSVTVGTFKQSLSPNLELSSFYGFPRLPWASLAPLWRYTDLWLSRVNSFLFNSTSRGPPFGESWCLQI